MSLRKMLLSLALGLGCTATVAQPSPWPPLPKHGFIVGRAATQADVGAGNAAFAAVVKGVSIGQPLPITIPQYAIFNDKGQRVRVIVIQAEEAQGSKLIGAKKGDGNNVVGLVTDFELLGTQPPKS